MAASQDVAATRRPGPPTATPKSPASEEASAVTPAMLQQAAAAGVITFLLTSLIVGIQTVSSTGQLDFTTRYKEVFIAAGAVFFGSILVSLMREGKPLPALIGGGAVTLIVGAILLLQDSNDALRALG